MRNLLDEPTAIAEPLSPHALSHVMSDLLDNYVETDEDEISCGLIEAGYRPNEIAQIMKAWEGEIAKRPRCSACGAPATAMWASISQDGEVSSLGGRGKMTPSCWQCGDAKVALTSGVDEAQVFAPLEWGESGWLKAISWSDLAEIVAHGDPEQGRTLGRLLAGTDAGIVREWLAHVVNGFAQGVADRSDGEITWEHVVMNLLVDVSVDR